MKRAMACLVAALGLLGCGKEPEHEPPPKLFLTDAWQPEYAYPGCAPEDGPRCPRSATVLCAVELERSSANYCVEDEECELVQLAPRCTGHCGAFAVSFEGRDDARAAAQAEIDRYCRLGPCAEDPCDAGAPRVAVCYQGLCQAWGPDAGPADAALPGPDAGASAPDAGAPEPDAGAPDAQ